MDRLQTCFYRNKDVSWRNADGKCILLHLETGVYFTLNRVGTIIWENLDGEKTLEAICNDINRRFDVSPKTARDDVLELVDQLIVEDLISQKKT